MPTNLIEIRTQCLHFLEESRRPDGSWGYVPGGNSQLEPTLYAVASGFSIPDWLKNPPQEWGLLLLPALLGTQAPTATEKALAFIKAHRSQPVEGVDGFDATLPGWSWVDGTAAWVEPSCWALLSLAKISHAPELLEEGRKLLLNRRCDDGGWNYGNPRLNGTALESMASPTAWAILALHAIGEKDLSPSDRALELALERPGCPSLALSALARHALGGDPAPFLEALGAIVGPMGARGRVDWSGLAVLAFNTVLEGRNVFL